MKNYNLIIKDDKKAIFSGHIKQTGTNPQGEKLSFTNYYMEKNGEPFFGICGEFHYSRYDVSYWEDEIIKMKMCGINIISTYIFWNLHEEQQGVFEWEGNKNLRLFVELCGKHNLYVIIRIGPFDHGEIRNGGLPDWLFGRPFEVRSNDEGYLGYARILYREISLQVTGLLYKEGGPIIGTQIENEHNHSSAQWAMTTGINNLWLNGGSDGNAHMLKLKEMAIEAGIDTPIYTCTGWGGASTPTDEMLPLWGGYSYWPWIYYEEERFKNIKEHPATPEYIYRDKHNNSIPKSYNFEPFYTPEDYPYACCEMGGGMLQFYKYRFEFPYKSVPAMTGIKTAEGCNILGYYMFHGGSNPKGTQNTFMNDLATPKISYDFNAAIGEFGQIRESYKRIKLQHYFFTQFEQLFCLTKTILPYDTSTMDPYDVDTLRYAARSHNGAGFLFINNFQDHVETKVMDNFNVQLTLENEVISIPHNGELSLGKDSFCMLPYNFDLEGIRLKYATTQLITKIDFEGESYYFFYIPDGMNGEYGLESKGISEYWTDKATVEISGEITIIHVPNDISLIKLTSIEGRIINICTFTDEMSLEFWKAEVWGRERILLTEANLLVAGNEIKLESTNKEVVTLSVFPDFVDVHAVIGGELVSKEKKGLFTVYTFRIPKVVISVNLEKINSDKANLSFAKGAFAGVKEVLLKTDYIGDIGYAFIDGDMINDNFSNNTTWDVGLKRFEERLYEKGMYLYISPIKKGTVVSSHSTMAAWNETSSEQIAEIHSIVAVPVYEIVLKN
ncbi:glycosyl hydrolase family 35 [Paenibacillus psychroresistens]|uniref:Glycosyl hydrolase family 35 n=1 Tax=Paenibacillus psychroresistens TaxID=1778678 RepID=A0A6B8RJZ6_9BACL|nr:beta-galactosidase [Paenibacillus psychroresistens]QGQ95922.1 glycosyl hydrolase family 35 [Paenibacillus psychroresistens]